MPGVNNHCMGFTVGLQNSVVTLRPKIQIVEAILT